MRNETSCLCLQVSVRNETSCLCLQVRVRNQTSCLCLQVRMRNKTSCLCLQVRVRDTDNDRLYSFELSEQLFSGSQVEAWKELPVKTLAQGGDEAERKAVDPITGTYE